MVHLERLSDMAGEGEPMTRADVVTILIENQVPTNYYSFSGAGGGDIWALELVDATWTISYYTERGGRSRTSTFSSEDEACRAFLARMDKVLLDEQQ